MILVRIDRKVLFSNFATIVSNSITYCCT